MQPGTRIAERYTLGDQIGAGRHGSVRFGHDTLLDRPVTIKILAPELSRDERLRERFRHVALEVATLSVDGVVDVYDCLEQPGDDGEFLICHITERVGGDTLRALLDEHGTLPADRAMAIVAAAARAASGAHEARVAHGNLKPENIVVGADDAVTLVDFGFRPADPASPYTAPETTDQTPAMPSADVFALGAIGYECLTGNPPSPDVAALPEHVGEADAAPILKALSPRPQWRFGTANGFADACEHLTPIPVVHREQPEPEPDEPEAAHDDTEPTVRAMTPVAADTSPTAADTQAETGKPHRDEANADQPDDATAATVAAVDDDIQASDSPPPNRRLRARAAIVVALVALVVASAAVLHFGLPTQSPSAEPKPPPASSSASSSSSASQSSEAGQSDPPPNSAAPAPTTEESTTSDAPTSNEEQVPVPNVLGRRPGDASATLQSAGFQVAVNSSGNGSYECRVTDQSPGPSVAAAPGSTVTITHLRAPTPLQCRGLLPGLELLGLPSRCPAHRSGAAA